MTQKTIADFIRTNNKKAINKKCDLTYKDIKGVTPSAVIL